VISDTIDDLQQMISVVEGIPKSRIILMCAMKYLKHGNKTLGYYNIMRGSIIYLLPDYKDDSSAEAIKRECMFGRLCCVL